VAVEMDAANAALARRNVSPWSARCDVIESAVWTTDGTVRYFIEPGNEYGASIQPDGQEVPSVSLETLIGDGDPVDYVKMDIEGAEREVLQQRTRWADHVRCMAVEIHGPGYNMPECVADLEALGFATSVIRNHFAAVLAWHP
jgi:FkbM family methyltransferase